MTMRRFTIRSLLLLVALSCVGLAFWMTYIEPYRRDARIAAELTPGAASVSFRPDGPAWLRRVLGDDYCCRIFTVDLDGRLATDEDLRRLAAATRLETLSIAGELTSITDSGPNLRKVDVWWWPGSASAAPPRRLRPRRGQIR